MVKLDLPIALAMRDLVADADARPMGPMAATICEEVATGIYTGQVPHPRNGYYAGGFSTSERAGRGARSATPMGPGRGLPA